MYSLAPNEWKNQIENGVFTETNGDFILGQNPTALMGSAPPLPLSAGGVQRPPARPGVMRPGRPSRRASSPQTVCPPPPPPLSWSSSTCSSSRETSSRTSCRASACGSQSREWVHTPAHLCIPGTLIFIIISIKRYHVLSVSCLSSLQL